MLRRPVDQPPAARARRVPHARHRSHGVRVLSAPAVVSIELLLDARLERLVRGEWDALAAAGLSSLARHPGLSNRPHLTLLARDGLGPFDPAPALARPGFALTLGAPLLFGAGERRVLVRSVVPTPDLLALHAAVHATAASGPDLPHTAPGAWTPHVTLARRIRVTDLPAALALVGGELTGRAGALRRWDAASAAVTDLGGFAEP